MESVEVTVTGDRANLRLIGSPFHRIDWDFPEQLAAALEQIRSNDAIRAVTLTGGPRVFSAGADISVFSDLGDPRVSRDWLTRQHAAIAGLARVPLPVIAVVEGAAAGAGMNLALAADHIVATPNARFTQAFIGVGLATDMGSLHLLPRRVGNHRARSLMYSGREVGAEEALAIGIVDELVPGDGLDAAVDAAAARFAALPLTAFAAIKDGCLRSRGLTFEESLDLERDLQVPVCLSADFAEGQAAFFGKRAPAYTDRPR